MSVPERNSNSPDVEINSCAWEPYYLAVIKSLDEGKSISKADWVAQRSVAVDDYGLELDIGLNLIPDELVLSNYRKKNPNTQSSFLADNLLCLKRAELIRANVVSINMECISFVMDPELQKPYVTFKVTITHFPGVANPRINRYLLPDFYYMYPKLFLGQQLDLSDFFAMKSMDDCEMALFEVKTIDFEKKVVVIC